MGRVPPHPEVAAEIPARVFTAAIPLPTCRRLREEVSFFSAFRVQVVAVGAPVASTPHDRMIRHGLDAPPELHGSFASARAGARDRAVAGVVARRGRGRHAHVSRSREEAVSGTTEVSVAREVAACGERKTPEQERTRHTCHGFTPRPVRPRSWRGGRRCRRSHRPHRAIDPFGRSRSR